MLIDDKHGLGCLCRLNGNIKLIQGNHDSSARCKKYAQLHNVELLGLAANLKYNKYNFYLSHYPTITSNFDVDKPLVCRVINLCGHSHTDNPFVDFDKGLIYHVELDAHKNTPVLIDDVIEDIKKKLVNH